MTDRKHETTPAWDSKAYRAQVRRDRDTGRLPRYRARTLLSILDCADRHKAALPDPGQTINFLGLGKIRGALSGIEGQPHGDWYFVHELIPVTGTTWDDWVKLRDEEIAEAAEEPAVTPRVDSYTCHQADGSTVDVPVCNWQLGLMLALDGPWSKELMSNLRPAFRRAAVNSGIGDAFPVVRVDEQGRGVVTGESMTDAILADGPLPSSEVAKRQATAGPLAAFQQDGDDRD